MVPVEDGRADASTERYRVVVTVGGLRVSVTVKGSESKLVGRERIPPAPTPDLLVVELNMVGVGIVPAVPGC